MGEQGAADAADQCQKNGEDAHCKNSVAFPTLPLVVFNAVWIAMGSASLIGDMVFSFIAGPGVIHKDAGSFFGKFRILPLHFIAVIPFELLCLLHNIGLRSRNGGILTIRADKR